MALDQASSGLLATSSIDASQQAARQARWLRLAQVGWIVFAVVLAVIYLVEIPPVLQQLHIPCSVGTPCNRPRLVMHEFQLIEAYGVSAQLYATIVAIFQILTALAYFTVAAFIFWRKRNDYMALFGAYVLLAFVNVAFTPLNNAAPLPWWLLTHAISVICGVALTYFFALFPTGTFVPGFMRWIVPASIIAKCGLYLQIVVVGPARVTPLLMGLNNLFWLGSLALAQIYRYRSRASFVQRQQTKWVVLGVAFGLGLNALLPLVVRIGLMLQLNIAWLQIAAIGPLHMLLNLLIPLTFGVAILRDGLYDLDRFVRRAVVYALLTGCVVVLYVLLVGAISAWLRPGDNLLVSLFAAGCVAVIFHPLRSQLHRCVNRLLYGERDDPYAVLSRLGQQIETSLATDTVLSTVVGTVQDTLKLPYVAVTLRQDEAFVVAAASGSLVGAPLVIPVSYQNEIVGQLVLGSLATDGPLLRRHRRLLDDLARQVGIALHGVRLSQALQASRERLVTAREEERRRLRRDLHDGLGPTLASLTMKVDVARALVIETPQEGADLLREIQTELKDAIGNVRRLVYALRPPALDQFGLVAAIREQVARDALQRGLTVVFDMPEQLPPLSAAVEVAAYFIVSEALTNVVRHAQAKRCTIRLHLGTTLDLEVTDDGVGLPRGYQGGVGLHSMQERAAELGGSCMIVPGPAGGTQVSVCLSILREG